MLKTNLKKPIIATFIVFFIFTTALSANLVFADGGSIAAMRTYPADGATCAAVDHFTYQVTGVNTNTTVSASVDNGAPLPMVFQGVENQVANGDGGVCDWYTWQVNVTAMENPGRHTVQFFSHYYVWQPTDSYWAEFSASSAVQSFTIADSSSATSTSTPTANSAPHSKSIPELQTWAIPPFMILAVLFSIVFFRKRTPKK